MDNNVIKGLDFRYILLDKYKAMNISEDELVVILLIDHLLNLGNEFITPDLLALKMNYPTKKIDEILVSLMNKDIFKYVEVNNKITTSLDPLYRRLSKQFQVDLVKANLEEENEQNESVLQNLFNIFQATFGRNLTPLEIQRIHEWVQAGYTEQEIVDALDHTVKNAYFSIKAVDKELLKLTKSRDMKTEGYSAASDANRESIQQVLEQAKKEWQRKNDD